MSKPNTKRAVRRKANIGSSKVFSAKKVLKRAEKKQLDAVNNGKKGHTPKLRKILLSK